jgi:hypothetical protein
MGMKMLLILRDPRDVVVSHARYVTTTPDHFLYEEYQALSEPGRLMRSITGLDRTDSQGPKLLAIHDRCTSVLPWTEQEYSYTTYFEKIVGPEGGGTRDAQVGELRSIARHLGVRCSPPDVEQLAKQIFGGTSTFRKGAIGSWRLRFSLEHRRVFKELAGHVLIDMGYEQDLHW